MKETIKNAIPAKNKLLVRNQTTKAIIAPGSINNNTFATRMIITKPMTTNKNNKIKS
jgi:hypothetical protein